MTYTLKIDRGRADHEQLMTVVRKVVDTGYPHSNATDEHGIPHCTYTYIFIILFWHLINWVFTSFSRGKDVFQRTPVHVSTCLAYGAS